ncbi:MAG: Holliday junction resolvase RuvX [Fimbriimonadaceae bacterium]|nr:Holliday junction resolvase RuvX [Fimbriimonadaceae bacterium]
MRVLGIDFGTTKIGVALGESDHGIASPRANLIPSGTLAKDAEAIAQIMRNEEASVCVLGLPLMEGQPTKMSKVIEKLAERLAEIGVATALVDESLTSEASDQAMREAGLKASVRRKRLDGEAAVRILERYFDEGD